MEPWWGGGVCVGGLRFVKELFKAWVLLPAEIMTARSPDDSGCLKDTGFAWLP